MNLGSCVERKHTHTGIYNVEIVCASVWVYLKSNIVSVHARQKRLKPLNLLFLRLLCDGLQNTLMTVKHSYKDSYALHITFYCMQLHEND